jgi:TonB family protein
MATLALFPMLIHAQVNSPAQQQSLDNGSSLQARLSEPSELKATADPSPTATSPTAPLRVSTGVVAPKLVYTTDIPTDGDEAWTVLPMHKTAVVALVVDKTGKPTDLKIVQSVGDAMDKNVLAAVSQYRFTPATVSHEVVNAPVNLAIEIVGDPRY